MQVTQLNDHVTHAVIGANRAIECGVVQDAGFMHMMSATLYKDQKLAVVREVMCNAWDAHIEFGCQDKPVEVTLDDKHLIIRDFGPGIPLDKIGLIYGTYGSSTKKNDGNQTGGFGLGSKAPWAYVDHFEVTSWNQGTKTIYNMNKSSAEVNGKPSIIPIMDIPTDEQGLQIKIRIKADDEDTFETLIRRIVKNGEMNVTLNGEKLETIPYSKGTNGFVVTETDVYPNTNLRVFLRYGNVIYPIDEHEDYRKELRAINDFLSRMKGRGNSWHRQSWKCVLLAPPNSIAVTPSRETLSMQAHTVATLTKLIKDFHIYITSKNMDVECMEMTKTAIENVWLESYPYQLFDTGKIPNYTDKFNAEQTPDYLTDIRQMAGPYLAYARPDGNFPKRELLHRLNSMIDFGFGNRGKIQSYKQEIVNLDRDIKSWYEDCDRAVQFTRVGISVPKPEGKAWFQKRIVQPLVQGLDIDPEMSSAKLFLYSDDGRQRWEADKKVFLNPTKVTRTLAQAFPYLRNVVILSYNQKDVPERAAAIPEFKFWLGNPHESFVYITGRKPERVEYARNWFKSRGYIVVDLTVRYPWEPEEELSASYEERIVKVRKQGLPHLKLISGEYNQIDTCRLWEEDQPRIDKPKYVIKFGHKNNLDALPDFNPRTTRDLLDLYGDETGVCVNQNQFDKWVKEGAIDVYEQMLRDLLDNIKNNPRLRSGISCDYRNTEYNDYYFRRKDGSIVMDAIYCDKDLAEYFGLPYEMTKEDKRWLRLYNYINNNSHNFGHRELQREIVTEVKKITIVPELGELTRKICNSGMLETLNMSKVREMLEREVTPMTSPKELRKRERIRNYLLLAIED